MRRSRSYRCLIAVAAVALIASGSAAGGRLSLTSQSFRITWRSLELTNAVSEGTLRCPVTLEGSFHSATVRKVAGATLGGVTVARVDNQVCTGGRAIFTREALPWLVTYGSFSGALPSITFITVSFIRLSFTVEVPEMFEMSLVSCRGTTTPANPASAILSLGAAGRIESIRADETKTIPLTGPFCELLSGAFHNTGAVTQLGSTTAISIRLI